MKNENKYSIISIISLITGIVSIICCCIGWIQATLGITAIVLGIITLVKKMPGKNLGIAGITTGLFGLILGITMIFIYFLNSKYNITGEIKNELISELYEYSAATDYKDYIYDTWIVNNGPACYILNADGSWGWYKDYNDLSDNYYIGSCMEILNNQEALDYYGMDENEQEHHHIIPQRFFCIKLYVDTLVSNGVTTDYDNASPFSIMIYFTEEGTIFVNMDDGTQCDIQPLDEFLDN